MKIEITGTKSSGYTADRPNAPGAPTVGRGKTPMEALGSLLYCIQDELKISVDVTALEDAWEGTNWDKEHFENR